MSDLFWRERKVKENKVEYVLFEGQVILAYLRRSQNIIERFWITNESLFFFSLPFKDPGIL